MLFEFEGLRFDAATGELSRGGRAVRLRPMAGALLADLVVHRARWVTRAELETRIWRGMRASASSHSTLLAEVRRAVGDDGRRQQVIRTCRRRGHRFVAPVSVRGARASRGAVAIDGLDPGLPSRVQDAPVIDATSLLATVSPRAERSLAAAFDEGPRHLALSGPGACALAREWAGAAADRGWALHRGWRTDDGCPPLWPWWQVAASVRDERLPHRTSRGGEDRVEWQRLVEEIEWVARGAERNRGPAERLRRCALLDGLARALRRRARVAPVVVLLEGRDAADADTERALDLMLATHAPAPLWLVTWSRAPLTRRAPDDTRTDAIALAPAPGAARVCGPKS